MIRIPIMGWMTMPHVLSFDHGASVNFTMDDGNGKYGVGISWEWYSHTTGIPILLSFVYFLLRGRTYLWYFHDIPIIFPWFSYIFPYLISIFLTRNITWYSHIFPFFLNDPNVPMRFRQIPHCYTGCSGHSSDPGAWSHSWPPSVTWPTKMGWWNQP